MGRGHAGRPELTGFRRRSDHELAIARPKNAIQSGATLWADVSDGGLCQCRPDPIRPSAPEGERAMKVSLFITCFNDTIFPAIGRGSCGSWSGWGTRWSSRWGRHATARCTSIPAIRREAIPLVRRFVEVFGEAEVVISPSASCVAMVRDLYPRAAELASDHQLAAMRGPGSPGRSLSQAPHRSGRARQAHPVPHLMTSLRRSAGCGPLAVLVGRNAAPGGESPTRGSRRRGGAARAFSARSFLLPPGTPGDWGSCR